MEHDQVDFFFPHNNIRPVQDEVIRNVITALKEKKPLLLHAPTGLGKTAAAIGPCLKHAIDNDLIVFFLTSRHTQHKIAVDTLAEIRKKYNLDFVAVDIIGKKWMCPLKKVRNFYTNEFYEYCKKAREENQCKYYKKTCQAPMRLQKEAKALLPELIKINPIPVEKFVTLCTAHGLCSYEVSMHLAALARVIITDYYYIFHNGIRNAFLKRINRELEDCILIIDEGHNLPNRIRELFSARLSSAMIVRAVKESRDNRFPSAIECLNTIQEGLNSLSENMKENTEKLVKRESLLSEEDTESTLDTLMTVGEQILLMKRRSSVIWVANFIDAWSGEDRGFARIFSLEKERVILSYRCLDPSVVSSEVVNKAYSTIMMSATLQPVSMYSDLLGFNNPIMKSFKSPFPVRNRLSIIVTDATTRYKMRTPAEYQKISQICSRIVNAVEGSCAIFFPSYALRDTVAGLFSQDCHRPVIFERQNMGKKEKQELLRDFVNLKSGVLMAVASGSFGEGIDLPGVLKGVIIVGMPLQQPDLETKTLIKYYDEKFNSGWEYGYIFPAISKAIQSAGRCIRSERDYGVVVFLDQRYAWPSYRKLLPEEWDTTVDRDYIKNIRDFFESRKK